ncbi:C40 family peptidase [Candidatus Nomurabacteria bacterium]|nr:C40 family peptidase [Candidatus Nomurabacteria bacterium]
MLFHARAGRCLIDRNIDFWKQFSDRQIYEALGAIGCAWQRIDPVEMARGQIGQSQYVKHVSASLAPELVDCSSFVKWIYSQMGVWLPRFSAEQSQQGQALKNGEPFQDGDLGFTLGYHSWTHVDPPVGHVVLLTEKGTAIHASNGGRNVIEEPIAYLRSPLVSIRRVLPPDHRTVFLSAQMEVETNADLRYAVWPHLYTHTE